MKKTLMILGLGAAISMFGCSSSSGDGAAGEGGEGGGIAGAGGAAGMGGMAGMGGAAGMGGTAGSPGQSGTTTWGAITTPAGGGTNPGTTGGCEVAVDALGGTVVALQTSITLDATLDETNNATTSWAILVENPLLGAIGNAAELGAADLNAVVTGATGGPINTGLTADAMGKFIGDFYVTPGVGPLLISSPDALTVGSAALTPDGGAGSTINVNWDGLFTLDLTLGGEPLLEVTQEICTFNEVGTGVDFVAN